MRRSRGVWQTGFAPWAAADMVPGRREGGLATSGPAFLASASLLLADAAGQEPVTRITTRRFSDCPCAVSFGDFGAVSPIEMADIR